MATAKTVILSQNHTKVRVKLVADSSNATTTTNLPLSGFVLPTETAVSPSMNISSVIWSTGGGGAINIYRGGTAESNLILQLNGNGSFTPMGGFNADNDSDTSNITVVMSQYGTLYLTLSKQSGWTTTQNAEQTGYAAA
jgi:hypothetical protein